MASTSITTVGGVMVVTQVIPKEESSVPVEAPALPQAPPPATKAPPPPPSPPPRKVDDMTAMFLRGEPMGLGVVQILIGVMCVLFSLTACYSWKLVVFSAFSLGITFVVSGSVAVAVGRRTSIRGIWACLVCHVLAAGVSLAAVGLVCWLLTTFPPDILCDPEDFKHLDNAEELVLRCTTSMDTLSVVLYGLYGLLLVLLVLQLCVSVTVCVFCGRAAGLRSHYAPILMESDDRRSLVPASP